MIDEGPATKTILVALAAGGVGFAVAAIRALIDGQRRTLPMAVGAILAGGVVAGLTAAALHSTTDLDPVFISAVCGFVGAIGDHVIVAFSRFAEPWRTNPKQAPGDVRRAIGDALGGGDHSDPPPPVA